MIIADAFKMESRIPHTVLAVEITEDRLDVGDIISVPFKDGSSREFQILSFVLFGHLEYVEKGYKVGILIDYVDPTTIYCEYPKSD